jgi:hypothetical protein
LAFHSGREADHSPPSSAEIKEWVELCLHGVVFGWGEHRDNFTFSLLYKKTHIMSIFCGSLTTAWRALGLRMQGTAYRYEGWMRIQ